jgi:ATP-dependent DNA helicase PIF1
MVDADLFDKLDEIARILRSSQEPFGGMQIIVTGDFFQLPPVNPHKIPKFAFEAKSWATAIKQTVMLNKVFRQKDGCKFSFIIDQEEDNLFIINIL